MSRSLWLAIIFLFAWGAIKVKWEESLERRQNELRYHRVAINLGLRDQLSQGMVIGLLSGFRAVVADACWLGVMDDFANEQWFRLQQKVKLVTTLQPRSVSFWEMGGWHLAWNASSERLHNRKEPNLARRLKEARYWVEQGRQLFLKGIENNPDSHELYFQVAWLYQEKLRDYRSAAVYYEKASLCPGAPIYMERFPGYALEKAGADQEAYEYWKKLWNRPGPKTDPARAWDKIKLHIQQLEAKLNVPPGKRVFSEGANLNMTNQR